MSGLYFGHSVVLAVACGLPIALGVTLKSLGAAESAGIVGHVVDGRGQPLPGVSVTTIAESGGDPSRAVSAGDGTYQFSMLPDGTYRVDFELLGFDLVRRNHVQVRHDVPARADATLFVSGVCECVDIALATPVRERSGQVVVESGRPLAHARVEVASPRGREVAYADDEGRFKVRLPVNSSWPLTASDGGFRARTQEVSGAGDVPLVIKLAQGWSPGLPDVQRFTRRCHCPGDLFTHDGR